jgi:hypothetical protein
MVAGAATTFYPCQPRLGPDTTHCLRPQAFRRSLARAHPSGNRSLCRQPRALIGGSHQVQLTGDGRPLTDWFPSVRWRDLRDNAGGYGKATTSRLHEFIFTFQSDVTAPSGTTSFSK